MRALSGKARLAGVIGWPVAHSRSPRLHGFWLEHYGIDGAYLPFAVRPEDLAAALGALPLLGLRGVNVTLPHKEAALGLCARVSEAARRIGAVNTIIVGEDGALEGSNTDGFGFLAHLTASQPSFRPESGPAVLLGAGGAARAIAVALLDAGVPELRLANRTASRAAALAAELGPRVRPVAWADRASALAGTALLVNSTTMGMSGQAPLDLDLSRLPRQAVVYDIVYVPLETPLLAAARARGNAAVDGLGMLLHQARPGFAAWFGREPEVDAALRDFVLAA
jgi:shikimate dehydrogenase